MRKKICFITAVPGTAKSFLSDHINALRKEYDVFYVSNEQEASKVDVPNDGYFSADIHRGISLINDLRSVHQLYRIFREERFDVVHSVSPKAGLLTAIAAWLAGIKHRVHIFTGQVWATRKGFMRWLLKTMDKVIARLDNHILVDGKTQRAFLEKEGVLRKGKADVFGEGSICGVNTHRFVPNLDLREAERQSIGIEDNALVFLFMGRLNHDKGIGELYAAYDRLAAEYKDVYLLLVGTDEENYISKLPQYSNINNSNFFYYGATPTPEKVLNAGDVFVLPTYREGFGTSVLEAACMGLPSITSDAYGVLDASVEGETGLRCKVGDVDSLYDCMSYFCEHLDMVKIMGNKSRERILSDFAGERLTEYWVDFYNSLLSN
jgi:glycosyltransferase involved in cell wall biosynthesis